MVDPATSEQPFITIDGPVPDLYQPLVEAVYQDDPAMWRQLLGDSLWFQFGIYDSNSSECQSLEEAGCRYFERQLELAGFMSTDHPRVDRVLDVGCGWGSVLEYLATALPECSRFDAVNVSRPQLEYCAHRLASRGLADRVQLFQCNARDIDQIGSSNHPYDLVVMRGSITHFTNEVLDAAMAAIARRTRAGGTVIISENLYNGDLAEYRSAVPDPDDRLACGNRKTLTQLTAVLAAHNFAIRDVRTLPTDDDAIRWLEQVREQIRTCFPQDADIPRPIADLREHAVNWTTALKRGDVSVFSIIAVHKNGR